MAKDKSKPQTPIDFKKEKELIELIVVRCQALDYLIEKNSIAFAKAKKLDRAEEKEKIKADNVKLRARHEELKSKLEKIVTA